jgi:serine phosphatase RsbU (regulator of sigma subunit)
MFLFSLIYGPIGIAGMATAEFIFDIIDLIFRGSELVNAICISFVYFLVVYFLSYFNYKLFYTSNFKNKQATLRLNDVKNQLKFILISIVAFIFNLYLLGLTYNNSYLQDLAYNNSYLLIEYKSSSPLFFIAFNLVMDLFIMSIFTLFNLKVYKSKKSKLFINYSKTFNILIVISFIILIIQIILFKGKGVIDTNSQPIISIFLNIVFIMLFVIFKPITKDVEFKKINYSFNDFMFFILSLICLIFWMGLIFWNVTCWSGLIVSIKINIGMWEGMELIIIIFFILFLLYYIQNRFSKPLHSLYKITKDYALIKTNNMGENEDIENILYNLKNLSNTKYEVGELADSLRNMIESNELYTANLEKITSENERIVSELNMAYEIQTSIIPNTFPPFPDRLDDFDIYASFNPARNVGGDFYDYFLIDDDHLVIIISDISGKGVPAALFMMTVQSLSDLLIHSGLSPSEIFYQLNNQLLENNNEEMIVAAWLGILEISSGKLTYVNAGHNLPYLFSKSTNKYAILKTIPNFVLGGINNIKYIQHEIKLMEGDRLYICTYGITKSINQDLKEFSNEKLLNILNNKSHYNIKDLILEISNEIHNINGNMEQFDDETMLLLEYRRKNM